MARKNSLKNELKGLGHDLSKAVNQMTSSKEFKNLENNVTTAVKSIAQSLGQSFKAAKQSDTAKKLGRRVSRVVKEGTKQGKIQAEKAKNIAARNIKKARTKLKSLKKK